jgi:hypothetical protein
VTVSYTRTFVHTDWVDNIDRVQAGGDHGFNAEFHNIEAEFDAVSSAINGLAVKPPPTKFTVTLTPNLIPTKIQANSQFQHIEGAAVVPIQQIVAVGMQTVAFPPGVILNTLRMTGAKSSGIVEVLLQRQLLPYGSQPESVATIAVGPPQNGAFDISANPTDPNLTAVDTTQYRYYLAVSLSNGDPQATRGVDGGGLSVILDAFQIAYTPAAS